MFTRTIDLLGPEGFERLRRSLVVVVGLGGVGSHAAVALARSGVGRLRLIDFDPVTASSLNRHAVAVAADVGRPKVEVMRERLLAIAPDLQIEALRVFLDEATAPELLSGSPDYVLDAIDGLNPKVTLLHYCVTHDIRIAASMGASARTDPTRLRVADLSKTRVCPLARAVRRRLQRRGVRRGVPCVYSEEASLPVLPPDDSEDVLMRGRKRNRLPSFAVMPGIFGYALAGIAIKALAEFDPKTKRS
ncbi:MAG: tRNA threonylcarbamoyladenosine dehydratase [Myxococcales bacterium]|nr:MAG: tRNA threonylcarbamoyladenosine dehydratase [Myxococcales bacterium]